VCVDQWKIDKGMPLLAGAKPKSEISNLGEAPFGLAAVFIELEIQAYFT
jgi:hypothetical protein